MAVGICIPCMGLAAKTCKHFYVRVKTKNRLGYHTEESGEPKRWKSEQGNNENINANGMANSSVNTIDRMRLDMPTVLNGPEA